MNLENFEKIDQILMITKIAKFVDEKFAFERFAFEGCNGKKLLFVL